MNVKQIRIVAAVVAALTTSSASTAQSITTAKLRDLPKITEIDPNFQSFNVEMVEVTGGRFWAPYASKSGERYAQRPPIDLRDRRLRALARALAPAYMRVSGTWANSTYIPAIGEVAPAIPPPGFTQVLRHSQWRELIQFANDLNLKIIASFPVSTGTRDANGAWSSAHAQRLIDMTRKLGGKLAAVEFANEPNLAKLGGLPGGYDASAYARDFRIFRSFMRSAAPDSVILGPSTSGEGGDISAADILRATANSVDAVSYHFYGALSERCSDFGNQTSADLALGDEWLSRTDKDFEYYSKLRDQYETGKPIWLTETAQAACGGSRWASSFRDSFRYVDQQGRLARKGVKIVAHNTLVASDYALIDDVSLQPRPSYWVAILWRRLMGTTVLERPDLLAGDLKIYAHCLRGNPKGVALLVENLASEAKAISLPKGARGYTITAPTLDAKTVVINGKAPKISTSGALPRIEPIRVKESTSLAGYSISFFAIADVANPACMKG